MNNVLYKSSTRGFGSIKKNKKIIKKNLKKFLDTLKIDIGKVILPKQSHSSNVAVINDSKNNKLLDTDGLITHKKGIFLGVTTADCLPIIFYEKKKKIVGVAHAGYKGIYKDIIREMINKFREMGGNAKDIQVAVGPSIGACCYDVLIERKKMFEDKFGTDFVKNNRGRYYLDLKKIAFSSFVSEGIKKENIEISKICTKCNRDKFFSYRGDKKDNYGEFITVAGLI